MLGADYWFLPWKTTDSTSDFTLRFFNGWYCEHWLPDVIFSNHNKLFISKFWKALTKLTGVKLKMSMAYHPQTDGTSEQMNKTVNQAIWYHVSQNQSGWLCALPHIWFHLMNTINSSTGFLGFQLMSGQSPRIVLPLVTTSPSDPLHNANMILQQLEDDVNAAKDNLLLAKITQGVQKNKHWSAEIHYEIGNQVMLSTFHHQREYLQRGQNRVAKFMPRFDGPFTATDTFPAHSVYTIAIPNAPETYPSFHMSLLKPFVLNIKKKKKPLIFIFFSKV